MFPAEKEELIYRVARALRSPADGREPSPALSALARSAVSLLQKVESDAEARELALQFDTMSIRLTERRLASS